jgi:hypothetical protein
MAGFDARKVTTLDWVVIGGGLLAFISSFFPWYSASVSFNGIKNSDGVSAWGAGFAAWFSVLLLVVAAGLVLANAMGSLQVKMPAPLPLITLGLAAAAFVIILLRWVTFPDVNNGLSGLGDGFSASSGAGFGLYLGLLCAIAVGAASFLIYRATGGNFNELRRAPGSTPPPV